DLTLKEITADVISQVERRKISNALESVAGNRTQAARNLGISLRSLMYKIKELEIR
ncbi:MAG: sigma-54-dependent Fis family transcriptional regulator, partial [Planctomycetes bacterium]|nr:sigma-54-dependent Fis family transcriptional regulator [Planctomycetota bacterium]